MLYMVTILNVRIQFWILNYKVYSIWMIALIIIPIHAGIQVYWICIENLSWNSSLLNSHWEFVTGIQIYWIRIHEALTIAKSCIFGIQFSRWNGRQWVGDSHYWRTPFTLMGYGYQSESVDPYTFSEFGSSRCGSSANKGHCRVWDLIHVKESYPPRLKVWVYVDDP